MAPSERRTARGAAVFWAVGLLFIAIALVFYVAAAVLLLTFMGILLGAALRGLSEWLASHARISVRLGLVLTIILLSTISAVVLQWIVPQIMEQAPQLSERLLQSVHDLQNTVAGSAFGKGLFEGSVRIGTWLREHARFATNVVVETVGVVGASVYVAFVTVYFAISPDVYRRGVLALVPAGYRPRIAKLLGELDHTLRRWLLARLISMVALGLASAVGLWILGIPLPMLLGLLAGVLLFVPYLGSLISAVPALLIALTVSPMHAVYVAILYMAIHLADGYLLDPVLQRHAIRTPPVLLLGSQLVFGELWGILGLVIATPLLAALRVTIEILYVHSEDE